MNGKLIGEVEMTFSFIELDLDDEMPIGKFKDKLLIDILRDDPAYLKWFAENVGDRTLCEEILTALEDENFRLEIIGGDYG
jgi:uncharacterized protein (DUF3820 family)